MADVAATAVGGLVASAAAALAMRAGYDVGAGATVAGAVVGWAPAALSALAVARRQPLTTTPADRVTLARAVLAAACAAIAVTVVVGPTPPRTWALLVLGSVTLALDAVDGQVARRTGMATAAGALLDMQTDAIVLVALSFAAAPAVGWWALAIGAMRYVFVAATWLRPVWASPLPRSQFRVAVAAVQGVALMVAVAPFVPRPVGVAAVAAAIALLVASFGSQVAATERRRGTPLS